MATFNIGGSYAQGIAARAVGSSTARLGSAHLKTGHLSISDVPASCLRIELRLLSWNNMEIVSPPHKRWTKLFSTASANAYGFP